MDTFIVLKNGFEEEIGEHEVFPGEDINNALVRMIRNNELPPLDIGDVLEVVNR